MEDYNRLERLETKVDSLKDDISDLKSDFKIHIALIEQHVAGDTKIIREIQPIIQEFSYRQERNKRITTIAKVGSAIAAGIAAIVGVIIKL